MKQIWTQKELYDHWTLSLEDLQLLKGNLMTYQKAVVSNDTAFESAIYFNSLSS